MGRKLLEVIHRVYVAASASTATSLDPSEDAMVCVDAVIAAVAEDGSSRR